MMVDKTKLPSRFFAVGKEPNEKHRVVSYSHFSMIDVINQALKRDESARLKLEQSSFGLLLKLPSMSTWSPRFAHFLLCNQLETKKKHELWFVFSEGILRPTSYATPISRESVELVRDIDEFLSYPWGRVSFEFLLKSVKSKSVETLENPNVIVQGFVYALQLVALKAIPSITSTRVRDVYELQKRDMVKVVPFIEGGEKMEEEDFCWSEDEEDENVKYLIELVASNHSFSANMWDVQSPVKRKESVRKKTKQPELVGVIDEEAQDTLVLLKPAKGLSRKETNPGETGEKAQGTSSSKRGTIESNTQPENASIRKAIKPGVTGEISQGTSSSKRGTNESNTQRAKASIRKVSKPEKNRVTDEEEAQGCKHGKHECNMDAGAVQSQINAINDMKATLVSLIETKCEELMTAVRSVGVCRHCNPSSADEVMAERKGKRKAPAGESDRFTPVNLRKRKKNLAKESSCKEVSKEPDDVNMSAETEVLRESQNNGEFENDSGKDDTTETSNQAMEGGRSQELDFVDRVHAKLNTSEYQEFLDWLGLYSKEVISQSALESKVGGLIGVYPDLMEAFRVFLIGCGKNEGLLSRIVTQNSGQSIQPEPNLSSTTMTALSTIKSLRNFKDTWSSCGQITTPTAQAGPSQARKMDNDAKEIVKGIEVGESSGTCNNGLNGRNILMKDTCWAKCIVDAAFG
ncbi:hypothetical protein AALP_AA7G006000 [Arabis alpina]|uniref:DUF1985 domain-containing protein n=1 Tax=Arabis alpina TaxID=50452 RepID=A0A087GF59_ARAAL|nr:hypothetical protein AALP_AA7G006000 [Arabis alpina]